MGEEYYDYPTLQEKIQEVAKALLPFRETGVMDPHLESVIGVFSWIPRDELRKRLNTAYNSFWRMSLCHGSKKDNWYCRNVSYCPTCNHAWHNKLYAMAKDFLNTLNVYVYVHTIELPRGVLEYSCNRYKYQDYDFVYLESDGSIANTYFNNISELKKSLIKTNRSCYLTNFNSTHLYMDTLHKVITGRSIYDNAKDFHLRSSYGILENRRKNQIKRSRKGYSEDKDSLLMQLSAERSWLNQTFNATGTINIMRIEPVRQSIYEENISLMRLKSTTLLLAYDYVADSWKREKWYPKNKEFVDKPFYQGDETGPWYRDAKKIVHKRVKTPGDFYELLCDLFYVESVMSEFTWEEFVLYFMALQDYKLTTSTGIFKNPRE